jgi:hypothetical protein
MFYWIYEYPTWMIGTLFAAVFVGVTWLGIFVLRRLVRSWIHGERSANDMVGFAFTAFSVLYGLLLGLLAVATYQNYASVTDMVAKEASSLAALYRDANGYPPSVRLVLQAKLRDYTRYVIDEAWPAHRKGEIPHGGTERVSSFFDHLASFEPANKGEEIIHAETLRQFDDFVERRRERLANVTTGIPPVLWWVVAIGALLNIALIWMLDMEIHVHLILGGMLSLFLGIVISLIAAMDNPFRGEVSVGPVAFEIEYDQLMKPDEEQRPGK